MCGRPVSLNAAHTGCEVCWVIRECDADCRWSDGANGERRVVCHTVVKTAGLQLAGSHLNWQTGATRRRQRQHVRADEMWLMSISVSNLNLENNRRWWIKPSKVSAGAGPIGRGALAQVTYLIKKIVPDKGKSTGFFVSWQTDSMVKLCLQIKYDSLLRWFCYCWHRLMDLIVNSLQKSPPCQVSLVNYWVLKPSHFCFMIHSFQNKFFKYIDLTG